MSYSFVTKGICLNIGQFLLPGLMELKEASLTCMFLRRATKAGIHSEPWMASREGRLQGQVQESTPVLTPANGFPSFCFSSWESHGISKDVFNFGSCVI